LVTLQPVFYKKHINSLQTAELLLELEKPHSLYLLPRDSRVFKTKKHRNIAGLVRLLTILAALSGIAIVAMAGFGMHRIYSRQVINMAEKQSIQISHILLDHTRDTLFFRDAAEKLQLRMDPSFVSKLNQSLSDFLHPFDIVKVKVFSPETRVVYSTDNAIIGELVPQNKRLLRALTGASDSHLEVKSALRDLKNETAFDVDVVETYIPITVNGEILGVFELYMDVTQFRQEIREGTLKSILLLSLILLIVYLISFSVARIGMKRASAAERRLRNMAMIDSLTGILNRGELISRAEAEISRVARLKSDDENRVTGLIMIDIDHFKQVNDLYGHQTGDAVLSHMPDRIKPELRLYDILGRYGGEEFLLILPSSDLANSRMVAERIRCEVVEKPFAFNEESLTVTISLGVSCVFPGISLNEAIKQADQALYRAKQNGRNRVEYQLPKSFGPEDCPI
jgi:diguanylate cyclase (GGDEF)-like protein